MEAELRGKIEEFLDQTLSEKSLRNHYVYYKFFEQEGLLDSVKSAMVGAIFSKVLEYYSHLKWERGERGRQEEVDQLLRIIIRRGMEIKNKINQIVNL